jgi:YHS domain-containing protein
MNMKVTRRTTLALLAATVATPVFAAKPSVFVGKNGYAINGYDPVAYFTIGEPVEGSADYYVMHDGATFLFSSAENKAAFEADTDRYAPQYGGYCAYAVSKGATAKTEPDAWTIVDDKLYLNYNTNVRAIWKQDIPGNIMRADANWPDVLN